VVQLFNREARAFNDFSNINNENKEAWTDAIFAYALYYPVVEFINSIAIALILWYGGSAVVRNMDFFAAFRGSGVPTHAPGFFGTVTLGVLIAFIQLAQRFFRPILDLSDKFNILQSAMAAAERIFHLLDTKTEIETIAMPVMGDSQRSKQRYSLRRVSMH
jgi:ATP-binding cassette subfamily B multidrug efflux pump